MQNSIATVSLSGSLTAKLQAIAGAGFDGVELFEADLLADTHSPREIGKMISDLGLRCVTLQPFRDFEGLAGKQRKGAFDRAERKFDLLPELGTDLLMVCSSTIAEASGEHERIVDDLRELAERASVRGLRVGYEALAWGAHINDHRDAWAIVQGADHPALGLVLDSFHSLARNVPSASILEIDPARIFLVQMADAPLVTMDVLQWSRHLRCMPGQGGLALAGFVEALLRIDYDDVLSLEVFNDNFRANSTRETAVDGVRSLIWLRDEAQRRITSEGPILPPQIEVERFGFIEFAASQNEAPRIEKLFRSLGFTSAGQHRSKAVTRWQQGDINFVLNAQPDSFAAAHAATHGASVCALGLCVRDIEAAQVRARALKVETFEQPRSAEERSMPAIRGVGGSLIEFIDETADTEAAWAQDFVAAPSHGGADAGLERIDHVAQTVASVDLLSWVLFYDSLFGMRAEPQVDIADPGGLVQRQVLRGEKDDFVVVLNSSANSRTLSSRFVNYYFGAGVQHIALSSRDIFKSVDEMISNGMEMLTMPDNYYADLTARFGLDSDLIERMRARQIIYDRDANGGEYFHCFTRAFERRFFFEIVQRCGYDGFDAPGAAIRIAAQSRLKLLPG